MPINKNDLLTEFRSKNISDRPTGISVDTIVIHSMYCPNCELPFSPEKCFELLESLNVSAHYLISDAGQILELVSPINKAWHAGQSKMPFLDDTRENVNDFSVGIELIGDEKIGFTSLQYKCLIDLVLIISEEFPIRSIVGHSQISAPRKTDPGEKFDWNLLRSRIPNYRYLTS